MKILKFGGSSISTPKRIEDVVQIVVASHANSSIGAVVFSAFGGVTDQLIVMSRHAASGDPLYMDSLVGLKARHHEAASNLLSASFLDTTLHFLEKEFQDLEDLLHGVFLIKECSPRSLDCIVSFGERFSTFILAEAIKGHIPGSTYFDARRLIKTDSSFGHAHLDYEATQVAIGQLLTKFDGVPIVTGFIASSLQEETTTLGRGGSDFTASILGAVLEASVIEIWTDVDGMMTADPRKVKQAYPIPHISFKEAMELSHFGAKVIYPPTLTPAMQKGIPICIKNTFNPFGEGTWIDRDSISSSSFVRGISSIEKISLLCLEGAGMVGVAGIAGRLFAALSKHGINIILISQASSEHSICFAISPDSAEKARSALEKEFALEIRSQMIDPVKIEEHLSIVAVVGENMRKTPGIAGKLFGALGRNGVSSIAVAQGSSELNISVVVSHRDETKALNAIHEEFFPSSRLSLNLFLVGIGLIGATLLDQIHQQKEILREQHALDIRLVGIADSKRMAFDSKGIDLGNWREFLDLAAEKTDLRNYLEKVKELNLNNSVFVDCSASEEIAEIYEEILQSNISIVTPNKRANAGSYERYKRLQNVTRTKDVKFLYETNVGAGLPIIKTVINLLRTGDRIKKIEAILSGTLSYLFNNLHKGVSFSSVLKQAELKGYTEPDPREDLSGKDAARKLLILARESGYPLEMEEISIEPLLSQACLEASCVAAFYEALKQEDSHFQTKIAQAENEGRKLRYIASFEEGRASIALKAVGIDHPFYQLTGSDNIVAISTARYSESPIVIKGPGAGAAVTAAEVFADILRLIL